MGHPPQISFEGISLFIIDPAPMTAFSPMVTDLHIIELHPMKAFFPIYTSPKSKCMAASFGLKKCANIVQP